jgi:hypothetical protein
MADILRKKSPRAPSLPLDESVERAVKIYDRERRHATPTDVIAQDLGYKSANNGSAMSAIASLRAYGLLEKAAEGKLAVAKDVEMYRFAPSEELRNTLRIKWLRSPGVFGELLDKYAEGLPSDASLRFDLVARGFSPASAESTLNVLRKSVEFARYFNSPDRDAAAGEDMPPEAEPAVRSNQPSTSASIDVAERTADAPNAAPAGYDRIPVRLGGGRRAWLEIPTPFYAADRARLKAQIDLVLAEDEENVLHSSPSQ